MINTVVAWACLYIKMKTSPLNLFPYQVKTQRLARYGLLREI